MMTKTLIDRIEGEASLYYEMRKGRVVHTEIAFPHVRGMERILEGKKATDALVITPRVCGICGHAHLMAAVRAIESAYEAAGYPVTLTAKAETIRELTLILEMIQNHFKWLYLVILPALGSFGVPVPNTPLKGAYAAQQATKILALFAGQWPHSSYMLPGGVTCEPTHLERVRAAGWLDELVGFFEKEVAGMALERLLSFTTCSEFEGDGGDFRQLEAGLKAAGMHEAGSGHDRFIVLGGHGFTVPSRLHQTRPFRADSSRISLERAVCSREKSQAFNVRYDGRFYEVGPLARGIASDTALVKNLHRRYKDSAYTRIMARVYETAQLLEQARFLLRTLPLAEPSYVPPVPLGEITAQGEGIVEAPRGSLIHRLKVLQGRVEHYSIFTPTQWNLGSAAETDPSPSQKAMAGATGIAEATFIFRSFDVCSVCTTH